MFQTRQTKFCQRMNVGDRMDNEFLKQATQFLCSLPVEQLDSSMRAQHNDLLSLLAIGHQKKTNENSKPSDEQKESNHNFVSSLQQTDKRPQVRRRRRRSRSFSFAVDKHEKKHETTVNISLMTIFDSSNATNGGKRSSLDVLLDDLDDDDDDSDEPISSVSLNVVTNQTQPREQSLSLSDTTVRDQQRRMSSIRRASSATEQSSKRTVSIDPHLSMPTIYENEMIVESVGALKRRHSSNSSSKTTTRRHSVDQCDDISQRRRHRSRGRSMSVSNERFRFNFDFSISKCKRQCDQVELCEPLGAGGTASVYRGTLNGLSIAVKVWQLDLLQPQEKDVVKNEAQLMMSLSHRNIVQCFGHDMTRGWVFIELFSGTFRDVLDERRQAHLTCDSSEIIAVLLDIANGLEYLHSRSPIIIHRDLKAENCFVQRTSTLQINFESNTDKTNRYGVPRINAPRTVGRVAIGDFGQSKHLSNKGQLTVNVGTPEFAAPETIGRTKTEKLKYNESVDIWSFGLVIFESLTCDVPYRLEEIEAFDLSSYIASGRRPMWPMGTAVTANVEPLITLFNRCTELLPTKRPTAKDLVRELNKLF